MKDSQLIPVENMDIKLDDATLLLKAKETGFMKRIRKFNPFDFIKALCLMTLYSTVSLEVFATILGFVAGSCISKQSLWERITPKCVAFVRSVLMSLMFRASSLEPLTAKGAFSRFKRVLLQDSTTINLPESLVRFFPGSGNQTGKVQAIMKIQVIHDLLSQTCLHFGLSGFRRNDQKASADILNFARPGDLVIRDLGYFVLNIFRLFTRQGIYFLTPYQHNVNYYTEDGERLDLLKLLKKHPIVDTMIVAGATERLPVRLVASPVPANIAQIRRRKLLKKDRRSNPTKEQLELLGWDIFLSNVGEDIWDSLTACRIYGIRWRIEILFKAWKSHFHFNSLPQKGSKSYIELLVYSRLVFITLFQSFFAEFSAYAYATEGKHLSLLKFAQFIQEHIWALILLFHSSQMPNLFLEQLLRHCAYESRHERKNYHEKLSNFLT
ncbi:IS4 family transposase [Desulforhabdus amnigena]|uniref:IS4 family transposase n=1 Tax=Desulforhabdus amnigena TaxID=40218 RepID=A0A9W6L9B7_9BACT|nr:IS4 family transposase [Desulforhabdus amnigena]